MQALLFSAGVIVCGVRGNTSSIALLNLAFSTAFWHIAPPPDLEVSSPTYAYRAWALAAGCNCFMPPCHASMQVRSMARMLALELLESVTCVFLSMGGGRVWAALPCVLLCMGSTTLLALARQHRPQGGPQALDQKPASGELTGQHQRAGAAPPPKVRTTRLCHAMHASWQPPPTVICLPHHTAGGPPCEENGLSVFPELHGWRSHTSHVRGHAYQHAC